MPHLCDLIVTTTTIGLLLFFIFGVNVDGLFFFGQLPKKVLKNECEHDLHCISRKCVTRTDFLCAAGSKFKSSENTNHIYYYITISK